MPAQAPPVRRQSTHDRTRFSTECEATFGPKLLRAITTADVDRYLAKRKVGKTAAAPLPPRVDQSQRLARPRTELRNWRSC